MGGRWAARGLYRLPESVMSTPAVAVQLRVRPTARRVVDSSSFDPELLKAIASSEVPGGPPPLEPDLQFPVGWSMGSKRAPRMGPETPGVTWWTTQTQIRGNARG
jgi:hypothetical protein